MAGRKMADFGLTDVGDNGLSTAGYIHRPASR